VVFGFLLLFDELPGFVLSPALPIPCKRSVRDSCVCPVPPDVVGEGWVVLTVGIVAVVGEGALVGEGAFVGEDEGAVVGLGLSVGLGCIVGRGVTVGAARTVILPLHN